MTEDRTVAAHVFARAACRAISSKADAGLLWRVPDETRTITRVDYVRDRDEIRVRWSTSTGERSVIARPVDLLQMRAGEGPAVRWFVVHKGNPVDAVHVQQLLMGWSTRPSPVPGHLGISLD